MATEPYVVTISRHRLWIEEPHTLVVKADGDMSVEDVRGIALLLHKIGRGDDPVILLQDMTKAGAFPASAREVLMREPQAHRVAVVISYGANFHVRVILTMLARALGWIRRDMPRMIFAANEAEARVILEAERERLRIQLPTA